MMTYYFVPKNLNPGASRCVVTILCGGLSAVRWCAEGDYPDQLVDAPEKTIIVEKNGTYCVELTAGEETLVTRFSVCHLKPKQAFAGGDGSQASPYLISNCAQFNRIRSNLHAHYRLISNLDFKRDMKNLCWIPIGNYSQREPKIDPNIPWEEQDLGYQTNYGFTGELDGDGHTISGLFYTRAKAKDVGVFGSCGDGAYIHHLVLKNCSFDGKYAETVGGIVGRAESAMIERCSVVNASISNPTLGGGIIGYAASGTTITECQFVGTLGSKHAVYDFLGGIVGITDGEFGKIVKIEDCCVKADLGDCTEGGGITAGRAEILRCFFSGSIRSSQHSAGIAPYRGGYMLPAGCVCAQAQLYHSGRDVLAEQRTMYVSVYIKSGGLSGSKLFEDAWCSHCGRIICEDHTLEVQPQSLNYCAPSCILSTQSGEYAAIDGSLRDGTTISEEDVRNPDFYRSLGWDFDTVWEIGKDGLPQIKGF